MSYTDFMIISIQNLKGGVGKSTTAFYLRDALADHKVLTIDATSESNLSWITQAESPGNIIDFLNGGRPFNECIFSDNSGDILPGSQLIGDLEKALSGERYPELILYKKLLKYSEEYDYTLIDCPPHLSIILRASMIISDAIIIPVNMESQAVRDAKGIIKNYEAIRGSQKYGKYCSRGRLYVLPTMRRYFDTIGSKVFREIKREFSGMLLPEIKYHRDIKASTEGGKIIKTRKMLDFAIQFYIL